MATAKKLPSGNYRVRVYDKITDKYKSFTAPTKREAERLANEYLDGKRGPSSSELTVGQAVQDYINERNNILSPASISKYQRTLDQQFSDDFKQIRLNKLTEQHVKDEVNRLSGKYSPKSVKNAYHFIAPIIRKHRRDLYLEDIQMPKVFQKKKIYPSAEEVIELFRGDRIELEVMLALMYGLRKEEIRGLKKSDIKNGTITINRVKIDVDNQVVVKEQSAKTENSLRQIYNVHPFILQMIEQRTGEYITDVSGHAIYMHFKRKMQSIGYDISFHDLRHVNASVMLFLGIPDKYAMERGGWSTDDTLKRVYQSTITSERERFDSVVDSYFANLYATKYDTKNKE